MYVCNITEKFQILLVNRKLYFLMRSVVLLSYHKSIACSYLHHPDFVIIHHVIYGCYVFQTRSFIKEARMGVHHRSFWERTIRQILSRPCKLFSCFFCPVFVLRQIKKAYFLYIPFFFLLHLR